MKKIFFVLFAVLIVSCDKDNDAAPTAEELLSGAKDGWIVTEATVSPGIDFFGIIITDLFLLYEECDKDNALVFTSDGKYKVQNNEKCDSSESSILEVGAWTLTTDKKVINVKPDGDSSYEAEIDELTSSIFRIAAEEEDGGTTYTYSIVYKPK